MDAVSIVGRFVAVVLACSLSACGKGQAGPGSTRAASASPPTSFPASLPPVPAESAKGGPEQPPIIWVGGTLTEVAESRLVIREALGGVVTLKRLGKGATAFFRASSTRWERLPSRASIRTGAQACVETVLDGRNLLALRVFLGAVCGPAG